jgi:hypothetical protein
MEEILTVGRSSRDAEGGARGSGSSHRRGAAGDWFSSPARVGASAKSFGSRFWVLSSELEGSDDEIWEDDGAVEGAVGERGIGPPPPSRTLGDFLGLPQEGGGLAGCFACRRSSSGPSSPARGQGPLLSPSDFPPLSGARVCSRVCESPEPSSFKLQVGGWVFEVPASSSSPANLGAPSPSAPDLVRDPSAVVRGDVDECHPRSSQ